MKIISGQFEISFDTNEITTMSEHNTSSKTKVEPRIMQVLQILVDSSPEVVPREQLITEVWNNYGGADDALNQAISHLRKILNDTDKENRIIETVVKKGYRFKGDISKGLKNQVKTDYRQNRLWFWIAITAITLLFATLIYTLSTSNSTNNVMAPKAPVEDQKPPTNEDNFAPKAEESKTDKNN